MNQKSKAIPQKGTWPTNLFCLVFALPGAIVVGLSLWPAFQSYQARSWSMEPAQVVSAALQRNNTGDGTTFRATGSYTYSINGTPYTSKRISFYSLSDNFGSYQKQLHEELLSHKTSQTPMNVWVNPNDPGEAVAFTHIHWIASVFGTLFGLTFIAVGGGFYAASRVAKRKDAQRAHWAQQYPDHPWKWREEWHDNKLISSEKTSLFVTAGLIVVWCLLSTPVLYFLPIEIEKGNYLALTAAVFPLSGMLMIVWWVSRFLRFRKYGASFLTLKSMPAPIGGLLEASVSNGTQFGQPQLIPTGTDVLVTLSCILVTKNTGRKKSQREEILWQDEKTIAYQGSQPFRLPIKLRIPRDAQPSSFNQSSGGIKWRLTIECPLDGPDYKASFDVPVFATGHEASDADFFEDDFEADSAAQNEGDWQRTGVVVETTTSGKRFYFPPNRMGSVGMQTGAIAAVFLVAAWLFFANSMMIFGIVFGLFGLPLGFIAGEFSLAKYEVLVSPGVLQSRKGWFKLGKRVTYSQHDLVELSVVSRTRVGRRRFYSIVAKHRDDSERVLAFGLPGQSNVEALVAQLYEEFGERRLA